MNSASAAAFISGGSVRATRREVPGAAARKEKNELHRAPLLKSPLGRRGGERRAKRSGEEGPQKGGPGSSDAAEGGGAGSSRALSPGTPTDSSPRLPAPTPAPLPRRGREGRGAAARAQRARGRGWGRGREARALSPGRQLRESGGFRAVPVWDPRPYVDFISRLRVTESGGRGNSQPRPSCD